MVENKPGLRADDVPGLLKSLEKRLHGPSPSGGWKARCYGPLLASREPGARPERRRGVKRRQEQQTQQPNEERNPLRLFYAYVLSLREAHRLNDADDLEALGEELLAVEEQGGGGGRFPGTAVVSLLTSLANLDDVLDPGSMLEQAGLVTIGDCLAAGKGGRAERKEDAALDVRELFRVTEGVPYHPGQQQQRAVRDQLDLSLDPPLRDKTLFSALHPRGNLWSHGLTSLDLRLTLPALSDDQPVDPAEALYREADTAGLFTWPVKAAVPSSKRSGAEEALAREGEEEEGWELERIGWEASCYHWRGKGAGKEMMELMAPGVPRLLTQDGVQGFESVMPAFLMQEEAVVVEERELVKHAIMAMRGIPSTAFHLDPESMRLHHRPALRQRCPGSSTGSTTAALQGFAKAGTCILRLEAFAQQALQQDQGGQVIVAFASALLDQLTLYLSQLDDIERQLLVPPPSPQPPPHTRRRGMRGPALLLLPPPPPATTFQPPPPSPPTLLRAFAATHALRSRARFLAALCHLQHGRRGKLKRRWSASICLSLFPAGSSLLSHLFTCCRFAQATASSTPQADAVGHDDGQQLPLLVTLLDRAAKPYLTLLSKWLYQAWVDEADDPAGEFMLHCRRSWQQLQQGTGSSFFHDAFLAPTWTRQGPPVLPSIFPPGLTGRITRCGKLLHLLSHAHPAFYRSVAISPAPRLEPSWQAMAAPPSSTAPAASPKVDELLEARRREREDADGKRVRVREEAAAREREVIQRLEHEMMRKLQAAEDKKFEHRRVLLRQMREREEHRQEQARRESEEHKQLEREGREDREAIRKAQEEIEARYASLVAQAEKKVAVALWRTERLETMAAARAGLTEVLEEESQRWHHESQQAAAVGSLAGRESATDAASSSPSFSGIRVSHEPGGGSEQVGSVLHAETTPSQPVAVGEHDGSSPSFSGVRVTHEPGGSSAQVSGLLHEAAADEGHPPTSPSFSGIRVSHEPGGGSEQVGGLLHSYITPSQPEAAGGGGGGDGEDDASSPSYSGIHISHEPGGSSAQVSGLLHHETVAGDGHHHHPPPSPSFSGIRVSHEPGGGSEQVNSLLHDETAVMREGETAGESHYPPSSPSFSGIRVSHEPGGGSEQVSGLLHADATPSSTTELAAAAGEGHNHHPPSPPRSSFSGKTIVHPPGGSSSHLAGLLWGMAEVKGKPLQPLQLPEEVVVEEEEEDMGSQAKVREGRLVSARVEEEERRRRVEDHARQLRERLEGCDIIDDSLAHCHAAPPQPHSLLPLQVLWQRSVARVVEEQCQRVERASLGFFLHELEVEKHIMALRRYLLGTGTAALRDFVRRLQERWSSSPLAVLQWSPSHAIQCFHEACVSAGLEHDPSRRCFNYIVDTQQPGGPSSSFSSRQLWLVGCLEPQYTPTWPLGVVLTDEALQHYYRVHRLLLRLHVLHGTVERAIGRVRAADKTSKEGPRSAASSSSTFRAAYVFLHGLSALITAILEHVLTQVDGECWQRLQRGLSVAEGVMQLRRLHEEYAREVASRCFTQDEGDEVGALLMGLGEWTCQSCLVISEALATERAMALPRRVEGLRREMYARLIGVRDAVGKRRGQVDEQQHLGPLLSRLAAMVAPLGGC